MVIFRGTQFFVIRFYFWVMRKHVSHSVWQIVWLQTNSFRQSVMFLCFFSFLPPFSGLIASCPHMIQRTPQCMVGESWEKHVRILGRRNHFLNLFLWIDSYLAPSHFYPASEYWINQSAILEEETAFSVRWEEEREALKAFWKKLHCSRTTNTTIGVCQQWLKQVDFLLGFSVFLSSSPNVCHV